MSSVCACTEMVCGGYLLAFSHLTGLNIEEDDNYHFFGPAVIDPEEMGVHVCTLKLYIIMHVQAQYGGECFY